MKGEAGWGCRISSHQEWLIRTAKRFRKDATEAERLLWRRLRRKQLEGYKFRRQQAIGRYVVDFVCLEKSLIIEVDGGQHAIERAKDIEREKWLRERGFRIVRFWNNDVLKNPDGVVERIVEEINNTPSQGGGYSVG